jgi:hypothetical protein
LDRLPLSLSGQPKGDLEREIVDLKGDPEREIVVGGRVGVGLHLGCLHLVHRHGRLCLCLCSHRGQMNGDKLLIVLVRRAVLGTIRAESGAIRAELGTSRVHLPIIAEDDVHRTEPRGAQLLLARRAELGTVRADLGTIRADVAQLLPASAAALCTSGGAVVSAVGGALVGSFPDLFAQDGA